MRYLSVCAGIEAATQAWHPLGWQCAGVSEIEKFPRAVLEQRLGAQPVDDDHRYREGSNTLPLFGDFTKIEAHHVGPIDLLVGGTPCQSFSVAGKRLGLDDPRGNLTLEFLALAKRVRPTWIVWENVPGVLSHDEGRTMGTFLRLVGECGFRWAYRVLDAQYVRTRAFPWAVPQRRRRVFLVGYSGTSDIDPRAVLFDRESLRGDPAPRREAGQRVAPTLAARTRGGGGLGTDFDLDGGLTAIQSSGHPAVSVAPTLSSRSSYDRGDGSEPIVPEWPASVAPTLYASFGDKQGLEDQHIRGGQDCSSPSVANCLTSRMHKGVNTTLDEGQTLIPTHGGEFDEGDVAHTLKGEGFDASEDGTGRGTPIVPVPYPPAVAGTLKSCGGKSGLPNGAEEADRMVPVRNSYCPKCDFGMDVHHSNCPCCLNPVAIQERAVSENPDAGPDGKGWRDDGAAYTLEARQNPQAVAYAGVMPAVAFAENQRGELRTSQVVNLTVGGGKPGQGYPAIAFDMRGREGGAMPEGPHETANIRAADGGSSRSYVAANWRVRRLTPIECERLQGFPDDFTKIEWRGKPAEKCPDGPRYRSLGNSMAINVMAWLGERIQQVDSIQNHGRTQPSPSQADGTQSSPKNDAPSHVQKGS